MSWRQDIPSEENEEYSVAVGFMLAEAVHWDMRYRQLHPDHKCEKSWFKYNDGRWFCNHLVGYRNGMLKRSGAMVNVQAANPYFKRFAQVFPEAAERFRVDKAERKPPKLKSADNNPYVNNRGGQ